MGPAIEKKKRKERERATDQNADNVYTTPVIYADRHMCTQ